MKTELSSCSQDLGRSGGSAQGCGGGRAPAAEMQKAANPQGSSASISSPASQVGWSEADWAGSSPPRAGKETGCSQASQPFPQKKTNEEHTLHSRGAEEELRRLLLTFLWVQIPSTNRTGRGDQQHDAPRAQAEKGRNPGELPTRPTVQTITTVTTPVCGRQPRSQG